jgi:predicted LPLAT superfamily acyltransferase
VARVDAVNYIAHGISKVAGHGQQASSSPSPDADEVEEGAAESGSNPLTNFATNLNEEARLGKIDPLIGREHELEIRTDGEEDLIAALRRGKGCLLLGAHLGSFDALRAFSHQAPEDCRHLKVVMDREHNSLMTRLMEELQPELRDHVIEARKPGPQIVLEVAEVLSAGGMVAMLGDRAHQLEPTGRVGFIDEPAPFPISPLSIAWILDVPVFLGLGLYEGGRSYRLVFEPLERPGPHTTDRRQRRVLLDQWLANYARRLEYYARRHPYNWFNFYDFWNPD